MLNKEVRIFKEILSHDAFHRGMKYFGKNIFPAMSGSCLEQAESRLTRAGRKTFGFHIDVLENS